jgi:MEMO1 family protein
MHDQGCRVKTFSLFTWLLIVAAFAWAGCASSDKAGAVATLTVASGRVRAPGVAGQFYPADPDELADVVDALLEEAKSLGAVSVRRPSTNVGEETISSANAGDAIALIAPHAGYVFSGQVAAYSFHQLADRDVQVVVMIASDHREPLADPIAVWTEGAWRTPLGLVDVDTELAKALVKADARIVDDESVFAGEHPIEVPLPFLQRACPQCRIVPVMMGSDAPEDVAVLASALVELLPDRHAVILASSDLSHYPAYEDAQAIDGATLDAIASFDAEMVRAAIARAMAQRTPNLLTCACGQGPILVAMEAARGLGADTASILHYANSGDVPEGNRGQVVGYGAVMFWQRDSQSDRGLALGLTPEQQAFLLRLARETVTARLMGKPMPAPSVEDPALLEPLGAFVTLKIGETLRGCMGTFYPDVPLYRVVQQMALNAAFEDPRFPPLREAELAQVMIEISILSPMQPVNTTEAIQIGRHGLVIVKGQNRAVFLPQVPVEQGWDLSQYLDNLCAKAQLPSGCWREGATLYTFTAAVFHEAE